MLDFGWYAVPESFKVYLKVDIDVAAKRAFEDAMRKSSEKFDTIEEQKQDMQKRYKLENERYWELYGVRKEDESNYDLVIDTTNLTPEQFEQRKAMKEDWGISDEEELIREKTIARIDVEVKNKEQEKSKMFKEEVSE